MSLPKKTHVWDWDYLSLVTINGRGKDCSSFLLESNASFDQSVSFLFSFVDC
jgi:hypothetical protein